jgi:hypothetical protein
MTNRTEEQAGVPYCRRLVFVQQQISITQLKCQHPGKQTDKQKGAAYQKHSHKCQLLVTQWRRSSQAFTLKCQLLVVWWRRSSQAFTVKCQLLVT